MYRKIVAGVDESRRSHDAAALAEAFAETADADLLLVSAYADPLLPFPLTVARDPHRAADARAVLKQVRPTCAPLAHTRTIPDVSPVRALRRCVRDEHPDLLVLGSSSKVTDGQIHLGRTGRLLVRDLPCAIAVAAAGIADEAFALREIVVGVDGRPESLAALHTAREVADAAGATLRIVGVVDDALPPETWGVNVIVDLSDWDEIIDTRRTALREQLAAALGPDGPEPELRVGSPAYELAAAADDADLLVVGARHLTTRQRLNLGSTSEALCRCAPCSILLVPAPDPAA